MDFKQLEVYVKVYELESFSRAAEEVFLSQPSVSAYVSALEKELKTQLIYRSTKEFLPTKQGKIFYEYAKNILALRDKSIYSIADFSDCASGNIDILASSVPAQYILPEILGAFHKRYPDISFNIEQADTSEVIKGISNHKGDVGFVGAKIENSKCVYKDFMSEKLILITPYNERFENANVPDIFYNEYFVMRETGSGTRLRYEAFLKELGVKPEKLKISARFNNTQSLIYAVASGLGISIVSELAAKHYVNQNLIIPIALDEPMPERRFYVVSKKNFEISPIVRIFMEFVHSYSSGYEGISL